MASLLALDLPLGPELVRSLRACVEQGQAFCLLDQRRAPGYRGKELALLGATHVFDGRDTTAVATGRSVDDEVALVMLTSGSSGTPKAAEHTWTSLRNSARLTQATLRRDEPPRWYPCLPPNHIGGLAVVLRAVLDDASLVWGDDDDLSRGPELGATHIAVVRTQLARHDLSGYDTVLLGGAPPPTSLPANVVTTWGMTETGSGVIYNARALPGVELAIHDGELLVRSPTLFRSYRDAARPEVILDGVAWFPTGDGATIDDGVVSVRGRLNYVINTGGEKVWPEDVERIISALPGVRDCAVAGAPDPEWGQRVVAYVVSESPQLEGVISSSVAERLGPWAKPKEVRYVTELPRTANGKLRRAALVSITDDATSLGGA